MFVLPTLYARFGQKAIGAATDEDGEVTDDRPGEIAHAPA
jgi:hypothetical protein